MSEELLQRDLLKNPEKIGTWNFYNIGSTSIDALKNARIIRSVDYGNIARKKVDAIITRQKEVIAIVENKKPRTFNTQDKKNQAILQEIEVAKKLKTKLIIATDTEETIWINVATGNSVKNKDGDDFKYVFNPKDVNLQKIISEIIQSINEKNDRILPKKLINPTDLAKQIWQDVWSVSGATPENCLYTFVELFIFKYLSDLKILKGTYSFDNLLRMYPVKTKNNNSDEESDGNEDADVLKHYANSIRPQIKKLFPENPIDKTTIINGTIFVSKDQEAVDGYSSVFKKILEKFKDYGRLEYIDYDFKSKLFESFLKESISKKKWGQFFTPLKVVRAINEMAKSELKEEIIVCDPACGVGKFPLEFIKNNLADFFKFENGKINSKITIVGFDKGFDKEEQKTIILAKANMLIYFSEIIKDNTEITEEFAKIFNNSFVLKTNSILGTLSEIEKEKYDLILTNPPYVTSGSSNLKEEIAKNLTLKNHYKINAMGVEGLFMEWIIHALKKGGKAFIVVPDGIFNRQNDKNLRRHILNNCNIDAIISLPIKTFFTTSKKTYILALTKKNSISELQTTPVFTYLVSEIGESRDINRFDIEQNDLYEAVELFNSFKGNKNKFINLNSDKRCKIQSIDKFKENIDNHWIIDKEWTEEEKVELGVAEENKIITVFDFKNLLGDITDTILNHKEDKELQEFNYDKRNNVEFKIEDIFNIEKGKSKYTKYFMNKNKGNYPVYSSQTTNEGVIANINKFDYDCKCLTWTTDGTYVGTVFLRYGKFSMTTHCGALFLKKEYQKSILFEYLYILLNNILPLHREGEGSNKRLVVSKIRNIKINIPITKSGEFDLQKQKEIVEKYFKIEDIKNSIKDELQKISNTKINIGL